MAQAVDDVSNASIAMSEKNLNSDEEGLSTDEEDDLNRLLIESCSERSELSEVDEYFEEDDVDLGRNNDLVEAVGARDRSPIVRVDSGVEKYWSTKTLYHGLWARKMLSRMRYKALMAFLHVVDPTNETPGDKLRKVDEFLASFKQRCKVLYQPYQNIAVDERMVKSKHISGIKQCMKNKPTKWGIKLWVLADSSNGYTVDFNVYIGKSKHETPSSHGLGYDVVMKLVQPYLGQGYHVYFDNFFSSPKLVQDLFSLGTPSSGTCRVDREGFPISMKNAKEWARKRMRGSMRWERESNVLTLQWVDNKTVSLVTSIDSANEKVVATRRTKKKGVFSEISVNKPYAFHRYNQYMNGVDRSDQMLAYNNVSRKCYKWWKTLFFHLIDMAVVNGYLLFQEHRKSNPGKKALDRSSGYSVVDFREELIRQICGLAEYDVPPVNEKVRPVPPDDLFCTVHLIRSIRDVRRTCVVCYQAGRGQKRVKTYCSAPQCNRYMHVAGEFDCFNEWHRRDYPGRS
ncbi:piggyBac transposable element-derived protein 4-like [Dendronephthya gigantea]|uniref:piggyBac transposable element-derived protein 4-like n=1 Tax=Dendronephthya gigantea TaxID=151771 RepID=UPI00106AE434|nr:piggyBac transposable element-derived protein 4-like [Dendronephthya gigantea]